MPGSFESFNGRLRDVEMTSQRNADRIDSHEDLCSERYKNIDEALSSMKELIRRIGFLLMTGMAGVLIKLLVFP